MAKTHIADFPRRKLAIQSNFRGEILLCQPFFRWEILLWRIIVIFPGRRGGGRGKRYSLTATGVAHFITGYVQAKLMSDIFVAMG